MRPLGRSGGGISSLAVKLVIVILCLILRILSLKKDANSLHLAVEKDSEETAGGELMSLSVIKKRCFGWLLEVSIRAEKNSFLACFKLLL